MVGITSQVVDMGNGKPAMDIAVTLEFHTGHGEWREIGTGMTNSHGFVNQLTPKNVKPEIGRYRMTFQTSSYFIGQGHKSLYPYVTLVFEVVDPADSYHIPLQIGPYGFSTCKSVHG